MKLYIIGPISGIENWKKPFEEARANYIADGDIVLSPLDYPEGLTQKEYMMLSVQNVFIADVIGVLSGSNNSKGAMAEIALAKSIGTEYFWIAKDGK